MSAVTNLFGMMHPARVASMVFCVFLKACSVIGQEAETLCPESGKSTLLEIAAGQLQVVGDA
jgi:hypothetical protein